MFYITIGSLRYGFYLNAIEEAEQKFEKACAEHPFEYVAIRDNSKMGKAIKEKF